MKKELTKKHKRISKAEQQQKKLIITGAMAIILLILIIIVGIVIFKSSVIDYSKTDMNTVFILKDGKVVSTDLETFDGKQYDQSKLESYITGVIDTYNKENGEDSVLQKKIAVEENKATLILEYANADVFEDLNDVELFVGSIDKIGEAGYAFSDDINFAKMTDGKAIAAVPSDFADNAEYKIVIIKSNTKVVVPGKICFVSTENVAEVGNDYVIIKDGSQLVADNSSNGTENSTESGTEVEGAVGEDEVEGGDGEIIFDFGDEPSTEENEESEVLTYIIYK